MPSCGTLGAMLERDRALLDAFRRGERDALTRVFRAYAADVALTLRSGVVVSVDGQRVRVGVGIPETEVESLIQETFVRAFSPKARTAYDGLRPYGAYLSTIARNLLIDRERARRRENVASYDDLAGLAADERTDPGFRLEEQQLLAVVQNVRASLVEPDATIFRLRFEERQSCRAIAEAIGTTEIVVRRRETRLRDRLLRELRKAGFLEHADIRIGDRLLRRREG